MGKLKIILFILQICVFLQYDIKNRGILIDIHHYNEALQSRWSPIPLVSIGLIILKCEITY